MNSFFESKKVLLVFAHPDDEVLACGGLLDKFKGQIDVEQIFIAEGESCRFDNPNSKKNYNTLVNSRIQSSIAAGKLLGIENTTHLNYPCGRLDSIDIIEINKKIEMKINQFRPDLIITHFDGDNNNDHRIVSRSVQMAVRPIFDWNISVLEAEVLSSTEWSYESAFHPNFFIELDIENIKTKGDALTMYDKEIRNEPHSRSIFGIKALASFRGVQVGKKYCEAFILRRLIS